MKEELCTNIPDKIMETFETMFGLTVKQMTGSGFDLGTDDIVGMAVLREEGLEIQIRFTFARRTLQPLLIKVYDSDTAAGKEVEEDAVCEIMNIVCASLKTQLNNQGHKITMGTPVIHYTFRKASNDGTNYLRFDFILDEGRFSVDIGTEEPHIKHKLLG
jgi:CheY-specific phosphatase CheX